MLTSSFLACTSLIFPFDFTQVHPKLNIRGFPTILYFPANNKDTPVEYQGTRTLEDLAKFIRSNAANKAEGQVDEAVEEEEDDEHDHDHEGCGHDHSHDEAHDDKPATQEKDEL